MKNEQNGVILPFRQNADFYYRRGNDLLESHDTLHAIPMYRTACRMEPDNADYHVALAQALHVAQRYEESIAELLYSAPFPELSQEALFGLASNFTALEQYSMARQCVLRCIDKDRNTHFSHLAQNMLALLNDEEELCYQIGLNDDEDIRLLEQLRLIKTQQLNGGEDEALEALNRLSEAYPTSSILDMEIGISLYASGEYIAAKQRLFNLFKRESKHVRAHCLMALILKAEGKPEEASEESEAILIDDDCSMEELAFAGTTFIELEQWARAKDALTRLAQLSPFDREALHLLAYVYLREKDRESAAELYQTLVTIDDHDTVASYYLELVEEASFKRIYSIWRPLYDVTIPELLERQRRISELLELDTEDLMHIVQEDNSVMLLLEWALFSFFVPKREGPIVLLARINSMASERLFRRFMLSTVHTDGDKHLVAQGFRTMRIGTPITMYIGGEWQYGAFHSGLWPEHLPAAYEHILLGILRYRPDQRGEDMVELPEQTADVAARIFAVYVISLGQAFPKLSEEQQQAMIVAFLMMALNAIDVEQIPYEELFAYHGVTQRRVDNAIARVFSHLKTETEDET